MSLTSQHKRHLRQQAHKLKPIVTIGNKGLTNAVLREIDIALDTHKMLKIKVNADDKLAIDTIIKKICQTNATEHVQKIGNTMTFWRD